MLYLFVAVQGHPQAVESSHESVTPGSTQRSPNLSLISVQVSGQHGVGTCKAHTRSHTRSKNTLQFPKSLSQSRSCIQACNCLGKCGGGCDYEVEIESGAGRENYSRGGWAMEEQARDKAELGRLVRDVGEAGRGWLLLGD